VIERGEDLSLTLETLHPLFVSREGLGQDFDCHLAPQFCVRGAIDLAHSSGAESAQDLVRAEARSDGEGHFVPLFVKRKGFYPPRNGVAKRIK
jgi:hypothetical protein